MAEGRVTVPAIFTEGKTEQGKVRQSAGHVFRPRSLSPGLACSLHSGHPRCPIYAQTIAVASSLLSWPSASGHPLGFRMGVSFVSGRITPMLQKLPCCPWLCGQSEPSERNVPI